MDRKLQPTKEKIPAPVPRRVRDLRQELDPIDRTVMRRQRRWDVKEPSPLAAPSNHIQFPLRLPRIKSRPNMGRAPFKPHSFGYTLLPPIRKQSKQDQRVEQEKRANRNEREVDTDQGEHSPTTGLFWDRDDG